MHVRHVRRALPAAAILTCLAALAPGSADAAKRTDWLYDVTVRAEMTEEWSFHEEAHSGDSVEPCDRYQDGAGGAKIQLRSRRPTRVMVMRGMRGQPPNLNVGTGEGIPMVGHYQRDGKDEERHEGPKCGPANPPFAKPTTGCGRRDVKADWSLIYKTKREVAPMMLFDDIREDCPSGPPNGVEWEHDAVPTITEVVATAAPAKFYGTKQFTIRGQRTFTGIVSPMNEPHFQRFGRHEVRWEWSTTYKLVTKKKKRKRRR